MTSAPAVERKSAIQVAKMRIPREEHGRLDEAYTWNGVSHGTYSNMIRYETS